MGKEMEKETLNEFVKVSERQKIYTVPGAPVCIMYHNHLINVCQGQRNKNRSCFR